MDIEIQQEIDLIKEGVLRAVPAKAIYLFGSHAYGTPNNDSDIDIYVVVPDDVVSLPELQGGIRELLWGKKTKELDLLMSRSSSFNQRKNGPTLEGMVARKGTVLYES